MFAAAAKGEDVPIILRGIGSVQAFNTVTVKSRVDGNIVEILFNEGQRVRTGDPLVRIDPRPYQALLDQAQGNAAKDQANLGNAPSNGQITYELDGTQYLLVAAGDTLYSFAMLGK